MTATPSARGGSHRASRPSFRPGKGARTPSPTTRNNTRRARPWNGASAGSRGGRRVATRYDQYAYRFLGFLYLAGAWIWLKSYLPRSKPFNTLREWLWPYRRSADCPLSSARAASPAAARLCRSDTRTCSSRGSPSRSLGSGTAPAALPPVRRATSTSSAVHVSLNAAPTAAAPIGAA